MTALHSIDFALAVFAFTTLVTFLGAGLASILGGLCVYAMALPGLLLGFAGAGGLVLGCVSLSELLNCPS